MFRMRTLVLAGCGLAIAAIVVQAQDADLKAVLRKSIEAHGGAKNLDKYKASVSKFKGTIDILNKSRDITGESYFQKPDKFKHVLAVDFDGKNIDVVTVFNGKTMWVRDSVSNETKELNDEKLLKSVREELQVEGASNLTDFVKDGFELSALGDVKIKGKDAIGIRVSKKGQRDISLFLDKKSHLIVKTETRSYDANSAQEVTQEKFMSAYKDQDGMKVPTRIEVHKDGKLFMEAELTEIKGHENLDDAVFAKP